MPQPPEIRLGALTADERRGNPDRFEKRTRIGAVRAMPAASIGPDRMAFAKAPDGTIGMMKIVSPGARSIRVRIGKLSLPPQAMLFVSSAANPEDFYGPFTGEGERWTPDVQGDAIIIESFVPSTFDQAASSLFSITEVGHIFQDPSQQPGPCHNAVPTEWAEAAKSVGRVQTVSAKGVFACTGVLLNTTNNSGIPYFLTANHCVPSQREATSLIVRWFNYTGSGSSSVDPISYGAMLLTTGVASDFSLLRLSSVPNGVRYSGWSSAPPAEGTIVSSIHHPYDSFQRYSRGRIINEACNSALESPFCANFLQVRWESGVTEPGSSGGPLWSGNASDPQLAGLLSGGTSSCGNPRGVDYFGRFDLAFQAFSPYLTNQGCAWRLAQTKVLANTAGDNLTIDLLAGSENKSCSWSASSNVPWITLTSPANGSGEGTVRFSVAGNTANDPRSGALTIAGQQYLVTQLGNIAGFCPATQVTIGTTIGQRTLSASSCRSIVNRTAYAERFTFAGQAGQQVQTSVNSPEFDTMLLLLQPNGTILGFNDDYGGSSSLITPGPTGNEPIVLPATGTYIVEVTSFEPGETGIFALNLLKRCEFNMPVRNYIVAPEGATLDIDVNGPPDCGFEAANTIPWIKITSGSSYTGAQKVKVTVEPTTEYAVASWQDKRVGVFTIAGRQVEIIQRLKCGKYTFLKSSAAFGAGPIYSELLNFISTGFHCDWGLTTDVPWIKFDGPASGRGQIETRYMIDTVNLDPAHRVGKIMAGDQAFTVTQAGIGANCRPIAIPIGETIRGGFNANCKSISSEPQLAAIAGYYTFNGVAGQQIAVSAFTIGTSVYDPTLADVRLILPSRKIPPETYWGGRVFVEGGRAVRFPGEGYFTLPETGVYTLQFSPERDGNPESQFTFIIEEIKGSNCSLQVSSLREAKKSTQDSGKIDVRGTACAWTARSFSPWLSITTGATGTGNGAVEYALTSNPDSKPRTGMMIVAGHLIIVTQYSSLATTVSSASYQPAFGIDSLASVFGTNLATRSEPATKQPLPTTLGGTTVTLKIAFSPPIECPLVFVSPTQINFLIPSLSDVPGEALLEIKTEAGATTYSQLQIRPVFPNLFSANTSGQGVAAAQILRVRADGSQVWEPVFETDAAGKRVPRAIDLGTNSESVYLVLYGTGFRWLFNNTPQVIIGASAYEVLYAGPQYDFAGLAQINMLLPKSLRGSGEVPVKVMVGDTTSNAVTLKFAP